jgi:16S rRNA (adenine1518-N6/adenine1519-N6)-dimethyltransferase
VNGPRPDRAPGIRPRKRFGQHFLHDPQVIARIVRAIDPRPGQRLVEIGPGLGAITRRCSSAARRLEVVEIDRDVMVLELRARWLARRARGARGRRARVRLRRARRGDGPRLRLVGNLPYNISTPLLFHLLRTRSTSSTTCTSCCRRRSSTGWRRRPAPATTAGSA